MPILVLKASPEDNVAMVLAPAAAGSVVEVDGAGVALLDDIDTVWQEFSDAVILGDSRAVGFSYYSFLDASRVLASSGERIDA